MRSPSWLASCTLEATNYFFSLGGFEPLGCEPVSDAADAGEKVDNAHGRRRRRGVRPVFGGVAGFRGSGHSGASLLDARGRASPSAGPP
jgi:hypothetical protein